MGSFLLSSQEWSMGYRGCLLELGVGITQQVKGEWFGWEDLWDPE